MDLLSDPKLMRAARAGMKGLELIPWFIVFAKAADDEGRLTVGGGPVDPADLAPLIPGQTPRKIAAALQSLEAIGVLVRDEDDVLRFASWEIRQGKRPSDSPEAVRDRVRRHRERQRKSVNTNTVGNDGNALPVTRCNDVEERRGEEREKREEADALPDLKFIDSFAPNGASPGSAGGLTFQECHDRRERIKAGIRELQAEETP